MVGGNWLSLTVHCPLQCAVTTCMILVGLREPDVYAQLSDSCIVLGLYWGDQGRQQGSTPSQTQLLQAQCASICPTSLGDVDQGLVPHTTTCVRPALTSPTEGHTSVLERPGGKPHRESPLLSMPRTGRAELSWAWKGCPTLGLPGPGPEPCLGLPVVRCPQSTPSLWGLNSCRLT